MRRSTMPVLAAGALLAAAAPAPDWRLRLPIATSGGGVQRIELPARAILALQRGDGGDLRVLDANGRAQPLARLPAPVAPTRRLALTPLPILGAADALTVTGVTLQVDDGQARVVRVDGTPQGARAAQELLGVLLDTRAADAPARALALVMTAPANQPVTVTLESSDDLRSWTNEGERVLFRAGAGTPFALPLHDEVLRGRTLRVTWRTQGRPLSPVSVTSAALMLAGSADASRVAVAATLPPLVDPHTATFGWPFAATPAGVRIALAAGDTPTAVRLSGRADREQPWIDIGTGIASTGPASRAIEIDQPFRQWQIAAAAGDGFDRPPRLELRFEPVAIAFVAAGRPPYTLAVGRADAAPTFLPAATLGEMVGGGPMRDATVAAAAPEPVALPALPHGASRTTWLLWGVLLLGVAALGLMAWTLTRSPRPPAA